MNSRPTFSMDNKTPLTLVEGTTYQINGINLEAPFKLTPEQEGALETIINDFIHSEKKNINAFAFMGYAGTGKTSIINIVEQYLQQMGATIAFTATTNRAVEVMKANNVSSNASTIHKLLGLQLHIDIEVYNADLAKLIKRNSSLPRYDFVVIDEASMISDSLYLSINNYFIRTLGTRVIFMGDPAQLRPIKSAGTSMALTEPKLECELTEVKRTSSNAILSLLTGVRQGQGFSLNPSQEYCFTSNKEEFLKYSFESFKLLKENVLHYRILCGTNAEVERYNDYFHVALFQDKPNNEYHVGDLIMAYKNGAEDFHNAMDGFITEIEDKVFTIGDPKRNNQANYKGYNLKVLVSSLLPRSYDSLVENGYEVILPVISRENDWTPLRAYLHQLHDNKKQADYNKLLKNYYFPENIYNQDEKKGIPKGIDYGYAMTVHKSQGGTYSNTGIVIDSFESFKWDEDSYRQMLYVAFSRCKDSFVGLVSGAADTIAFATADEVSDQASQHVESVSMPLPDNVNTADWETGSQNNNVGTIILDVGNATNEETRQLNYDAEEIPF
ncbi:ATP-dependent DNA helicase [Thiothrix nivea]|uniref:UvrD-like helicase C-terminal domain-containing protein n=1 Tax=Thiothrix nivea (strain ATCC 35100 / DSM 5205 / JP2) TaxID=870187 RepID=A0A656HJT0_THINJ|nr:AAA family ATPase [Thiothrix nivea]EIJ35275.1 hypothetical protein Thini_2738 [Thiothrix nivea DSM 5205]